MHGISIWRRITLVVFYMALISMPFFFYRIIAKSLPDEIYLIVNDTQDFDYNIPVTATMEQDAQVFASTSDTSSDDSVAAINMDQDFTLTADETGTYTLACKLFGIIDWKDVTVNVVEDQEVIPSGVPIGIYMETKGVMVIGTCDIRGMDGMSVEPAKNLVKSGDYILAVNGTIIDTKEELVDLVNQSDGAAVVLEVERDGETFTVQVTPVQTKVDEYKMGIWVKDDLAGIGTITYYETDGSFGALGHSITDIDTGLSVSLGDGELYPVNLTSITKGVAGTPGQLYGEVLCYEGSIGTLSGNSDSGIFGTLNNTDIANTGCEPVEVAMKQEVQLGEAQIYSSLSGEPCYYDINIIQVDEAASNENKGICFVVTDQDLLDLTGGVVQGMSGSPILQNGKLIGAVTHVCVNDPTKGYGVFAETMLTAMDGDS